MRLIHEGPNTAVFALDPPADGGACHDYQIRAAKSGAVLATIHFQKGPIGESGVNGIQHDDVLRILLDRLDGFQGGPYASAVNEVAAGHIGAALAADETRTRRRQRAGTEGTSKA
jgi:hypothetical protein